MSQLWCHSISVQCGIELHCGNESQCGSEQQAPTHRLLGYLLNG